MSKVPKTPKKTKKQKTKDTQILRMLESIHKILEKQSRLRTAFAMGIMRGLGTALGATVIVAILGSIAISVSSALDLDTFLKAFFGEV